MIRLTEKEFLFLVNYVKSNYGIDLARKRVLLEGRLNSYLFERGLSDYTSYIKILEADRSGKELTNLLNRVTTNHTFFMRESSHFDFLRETVLPRLEQGVRDRDLRVWCAASSTGEEPYTLAMVLNDYFANKSPPWEKTLLATDLSTKVLEQAQKGVFSTESIDDVPEKWKRCYFTKADVDSVQVVPEIRSQIVFR